VLWWNEDFDASCDAWLASDQTRALKGKHHLVDGRRRDVEVTLHVGFGWGLPEHALIDADEGQILALLLGEAMRAGAVRGA
jgi:hypothetical protein